MKDRIILHSDMNCYYASIEHLHHPQHHNQPLAVGGREESRHGIILTADYLAKKHGVKTGMTIWEAKKRCPKLVIIEPHMDVYLRFSRMAREIYEEYTPLVEPFGIDESWLDVTQSGFKGDGLKIAQEIRKRIKDELGVTVSIGVSFNKIFAKLGSDMKKPDAVTTVYRTEYQKKAWALPASDLFYVGKSTKRKLHLLGIDTIGALATADTRILEAHLGKMGLILHAFANGEDDAPVRTTGDNPIIKSIGNSTTTPRDLLNISDATIIIYALAESVAARLRENGYQCKTVEICVRDKDLYSFSRQKKLIAPSNITAEIAQAAVALVKQYYTWDKPLRSVGVRGLDLIETGGYEQQCLFVDEEVRKKLAKADRAVDEIRRRFGYQSIQRGLMYQDRYLSSINAKEDHVVHPHGYFG